METIWYVFRKRGGPPSYQHPSYESAVEEAKRLVDTFGGEYEILELKSVVKTAPKHVVEVTTGPTRWLPTPYDNDKVPF